jgi:hypothetical protein
VPSLRKGLRADLPHAFQNFPERNLGMQVINTADHRALALLALFRDVYIRHVRIPNTGLRNDQASFREALFTLRATVHDVVVPANRACRFTGGCADGCQTVHRWYDQDKSGRKVGINVKNWNRHHPNHTRPLNH